MLRALWARFTGNDGPEHRQDIRLATGFDPVEMVWRDDTRMPIPAWREISKSTPRVPGHGDVWGRPARR